MKDSQQYVPLLVELSEQVTVLLRSWFVQLSWVVFNYNGNNIDSYGIKNDHRG